MPTVDWVLLGSCESNKGLEFGSLYMQLVCRRTLPSAGKACYNNNNDKIFSIVMRPSLSKNRQDCNEGLDMCSLKAPNGQGNGVDVRSVEEGCWCRHHSGDERPLAECQHVPASGDHPSRSPGIATEEGIFLPAAFSE